MSQKVCVTHSRAEDVASLTKLAKQVWGEYAFPVNFYRQAVDIFGDSIFLAKNEGGVIVGYLVALIVSQPYLGMMRILSLGVEPTCRNLGVGTLLLQSALAYSAKWRVSSITAMIAPDNVPSRRLFSKVGFEEMEMVRDYYEIGEHVLLYKINRSFRELEAIQA